MSQIKPVGLFGKLPAHGDFIYRNLPTNFINGWDTWLQGFIGSSKEQLGESWLDIYLTSPIWRFAFSEGVIDERVWAGIVLPSVDRVGRYFPFSIATSLPVGMNPLEVITQSAWFESIETAALKGLDGQLQIDDLVDDINQYKLIQSMIYQPVMADAENIGAVIKMDFEEQSLQSVYPFLFDAALRKNLSSYSVWSTRGSNYVEPCIFYARGLPQMRGIAAMLDGNWESWGWNEPYRLKPAQ